MSNGVEHTINYIYFWQAADLCTVFAVVWDELNCFRLVLLRLGSHVVYFSKMTAKYTKTIWSIRQMLKAG